MRQHSAVRDAVAIARDDTSGNKRLVAYVVQNAGFKGTNETVAGSEWDAERISNWQSVFNDSYRQTPSDRDGIFNIAGWNSSYTDLPLSETEMREWLDLTIERIRALQPQRVLEIGCGTGLLLFRIAPHCAQYWGEISPKSRSILSSNSCDRGSKTCRKLSFCTKKHRTLKESSRNLST